MSCAESRNLVVLNSMTIFVQNNFGIFGVIYSSSAER